MKKTKTVLSLSLCLALLFTFFIPAFAADDIAVGYAAAPNEYDSAAVPDDIDKTVDWEGFVEVIREAILNRTVTVNVSDFNIPYTEPNKEYISSLIYDTPSLLHAIRYFGYSYSQSNTIYSLIITDYLFSGDEYAEMLAVCEDAKNSLLYGIRDNDALSDAEKCLILHDRLAAWCEYDYQNRKNNTVPDTSYSAYGPLGLHVAVCQGYSYAYQWMLEDLGIRSCYTSSEQLNHGWTTVYIDGEPYYTDVTWDDPTWDVSGKVMHDNFLLSFETFSEGHGGATDFSAEPASAIYEDGFWTDAIDTEIVYVNGKFYYFAPVANSADYALLARDASGNVETVRTFTHRWKTAGGSNYRNQAKLTQYGDRLLYSTSSDIRLYDPATDEETVVFVPELASGVCIYGFTQIDGTLIVEKNTSPSFDKNTKTNGQIKQAFCTEHTNRELLEQPAPATATGSEKYVCSDCRKVFTVDIPGHEHSFGEWTAVTAATCAAPGSRTRTCADCGYVDTEETDIDPANHTGGTEIRDAVTATCSTSGYTGDTYCLGCNAKLATGTNTGKNASNHEGGTEVRGAVPATCRTSGYTGDTYCLGCNAKLASGRKISANRNAHPGSYVFMPGKAPNCTNGGYTEERKCIVCGQLLARRESVPATGHDYRLVKTVAPTCTAKGYDEYKCAVCAIVKKCNYTEKTAHSYVSEVIAPTCAKGGYTVRTCAGCGYTYKTDETPAAGHRDGNGDCVCDVCSAKLSPKATCASRCRQACSVCRNRSSSRTISGMKKYVCKCGREYW